MSLRFFLGSSVFMLLLASYSQAGMPQNPKIETKTISAAKVEVPGSISTVASNKVAEPARPDQSNQTAEQTHRPEQASSIADGDHLAFMQQESLSSPSEPT